MCEDLDEDPTDIRMLLFCHALVDFTEMCSVSEAGSYIRLIDFVYHSTPGLRVIKKKKKGKVNSTST